MELTVLTVRYPRGSLPVKGFRCPICGEEEMLLDEAARARSQARGLGLLAPKHEKHRRLLRVGNSLGVTLDPEILREAFGNADPGADVIVAAEGDSIVIRRE
ncbi:MAG: AbrB/MazE/SpoVT family DNA-binding domain-containing protein [Thermoplasmatota archaeon]